MIRLAVVADHGYVSPTGEYRWVRVIERNV